MMRSFRKKILKYYREHGRHSLPWRDAKDPYRILVSEVMLQQTQVDRVLPKYKEFLKKFPTVRALARASLFDVLAVWSGLGYNRRAKFLRDAAIAIVKYHRGDVPRDYEGLVELPGVGDYTARAVRIFAFNERDVLIETNIRTVFFDSFREMWTRRVHISDKDLLLLAQAAAKEQKPREWHYALMDYGAHLKRSGVRNNHKSKHYVRQSRFEGSLRQIRGAILRELQTSARKRNALRSDLRKSTRSDLGKFSQALASLARDGLITENEGTWAIS